MTFSMGASHNDPDLNSAIRRDPEDRKVQSAPEHSEKMMDKTLADSFPTSDPPSSIPNPGEPDSDRSGQPCQPLRSELLQGLTPGSWVAVSLDGCEILGHGPTRTDAEQSARGSGHSNFSLDEVPADPGAPLQAPTSA